MFTATDRNFFFREKTREFQVIVNNQNVGIAKSSKISVNSERKLVINWVIIKNTLVK